MYNEMWADEITDDQAEYLTRAAILIATAQVATVEEIQEKLGFGIIDEAIIEGTFRETLSMLQADRVRKALRLI